MENKSVRACTCIPEGIRGLTHLVQILVRSNIKKILFKKKVCSKKYFLEKEHNNLSGSYLIYSIFQIQISKCDYKKKDFLFKIRSLFLKKKGGGA